jgi:hypothetical protein
MGGKKNTNNGKLGAELPLLFESMGGITKKGENKKRFLSLQFLPPPLLV